MENRGFKGVWFPKELWLDRNISMIEKGLFIEIHSLSQLEKGCIKSNDAFAEFLGVTKRTVINALNKLKELGYVEQVGFDGRKRELKAIWPYDENSGFAWQSRKKFTAEVKKVHGRSENFSKSSIKNNTMNNTENKTLEDESQNQLEAVPPSGGYKKDSIEKALKEEIEKAFLLVIKRFKNHAKERQAVKQLAKEAIARSNDPFNYMRILMNTFWNEKTYGKNKFIKDQPFCPSALNCARVFEMMVEKAFLLENQFRPSVEDIQQKIKEKGRLFVR